MRDDAQHAGALSIPVQAGGEQETTQLARFSVELCVKAVGQGDSSPFVPLSHSLDSQIGLTVQQGCRTGKHRTPPERSCMCLLMTCRCLQIVTFRYTAAKHKVSQKYRYPMLSRNRLSAADIQSYVQAGPGQK